MTLQEIFDISVNGIRSQGCRSVDGQGKCRYRGPNGTKCAYGWHIPDDKYRPSFEYRHAISVERELGNPHAVEELSLLASLQNAHDGDHTLSAKSLKEQEQIVEAAFEQVAKKFNLNYERKPWTRC